jgi:hypothetical protein
LYTALNCRAISSISSSLEISASSIFGHATGLDSGELVVKLLELLLELLLVLGRFDRFKSSSKSVLFRFSGRLKDVCDVVGGVKDVAARMSHADASSFVLLDGGIVAVEPTYFLLAMILSCRLISWCLETLGRNCDGGLSCHRERRMLIWEGAAA